jgi:hypothetical protein
MLFARWCSPSLESLSFERWELFQECRSAGTANLANAGWEALVSDVTEIRLQLCSHDPRSSALTMQTWWVNSRNDALTPFLGNADSTIRCNLESDSNATDASDVHSYKQDLHLISTDAGP